VLVAAATTLILFPSSEIDAAFKGVTNQVESR
jgi:hypothetical protein